MAQDIWSDIMGSSALARQGCLDAARQPRIPWAKPLFGERERQFVLDAVDSGWISCGRYVARFEEEFARRLGRTFAVAVSSGTSALQLVLMSLGIGRGDEVIVPGFSFAAPANMVRACGAACVYADIDEKSWCIDPQELLRLIGPRTKAVIAVHVYGNVCDMEKLLRIARDRGIFLIEDAAHAHFSEYKGRYAGCFGDTAIFSFQSAKVIAMGEGGCVVTDDAALCERMKVMRDHGMCRDKRYWHEVAGFNFRLTDLQAAVGCAQLENIDYILAQKKRVLEAYLDRLADEPAVRCQFFYEGVKPVVWVLAIKIDQRYFPGDRDYIMQVLFERGIETRPGFYPFDMMPLYQAPLLPVSRQIGLNVISLPSYPSLTEEEIDYVCRQLRKLVIKR